MAVSAMFLTGYGLFRFFVEFYRQPDSAIGFVAFGWLTMRNLEIDVFPDLTAPSVAILTESPGMATEDVERLITFPIVGDDS